MWNIIHSFFSSRLIEQTNARLDIKKISQKSAGDDGKGHRKGPGIVFRLASLEFLAHAENKFDAFLSIRISLILIDRYVEEAKNKRQT